jgi:hypothetical protein
LQKPELRPLLKQLGDRLPLLGRAWRAIRDANAERTLDWQRIPETELEVLGGNWLAAGGDHELFELKLFRSLLDKVDCVIDVGANSGIYSCLAAARGKRVFAFEPMPQNARILARSLRRNRLDGRVELFPIAASDRVGVTELYGAGQGASLVAD